MSKTAKKQTTKTYIFHEISSYLPLLEGEEFDALVEDIKQFGQIEPAVLLDGKLIDGRNRYRACKQLDIELKVREWNPSEFTGMTPLQFVISENIMRRHLNYAQKSEVGLLLLEEEEKLAQERLEEISKLPQKERGTEKVKAEIEKKYGEFGRSDQKVANKVKVGKTIISQAKKIKQIAKGYEDKEGIIHPPEPIIAEEWEKAKKGDQGVEAVYQKAKIIENIGDLPKNQQNEIKTKISTETISKVIEFVKEKKDDQKRLEDAEEFRKMQKEEKELKELYEKIEACKKRINGFENIVKTTEAQLTVLSKEVVKKYPQWEKIEPIRMSTELSLLYDSLDTNSYDNQLKALKTEYDKLMKPLREKLEKLEKEYNEKKNEIVKQKSDMNAEIKWIEKYEDLMGKVFEKIEVQKQNINSAKDKLKSMLEEYEKKYK